MASQQQAVARQYQIGRSEPQFAAGRCVACATRVDVDPALAFDDDSIVGCGHCGANTPRRRLILEALALVDTVAWSLLCSDIYIWDQTRIAPGETISYDVQIQVTKWQHHEAHPVDPSEERYIPTINFYDQFKWAFLSVTDSQAASRPAESPPPQTDVLWYRFGISEPDKVPAWRQSLFGAATLAATHPSAAIVLVAAGFEAFFLETMRITWRESQLDPAAFRRLNARNPPISQLIEWLPAAVSRPTLRDASPSLHQRWDQLVNRRRNAVVHEANVHFNSEQARESMRAALECIAFLDPSALVRPHAYYAAA